MPRIHRSPESDRDFQVPVRPVEILLEAKAIAGLAGVSLRTFQRWVSTGFFPCADLRHGRIVRWKSSTVNLWMDNNLSSTDWRAAS